MNIPNSKGENILLFLAQTVGRQSAEQKQYRPARSRASGLGRKVLSSDAEPDMPEHDLQPPRFAVSALDRLLKDWSSVKAMLLSGYKEEPSSASGTLSEDQLYMQSQSGTTLLDKFTHCLIVKCSMEMLDALLATLVKEMENKTCWTRQQEAKLAARRFVRSVARVFVVFSVEIAPQSGKRKSSSSSSSSSSQPLVKCKHVFQSLINLAIEELCEVADALIAPVRLGVARPTIPFPLVSSNADAIHGSEELFSVDPLQLMTPRAVDDDTSDTVPPAPSSGAVGGHARATARRTESEEMDNLEGDEGEVDGDGEADNSDHEDAEVNARGNGAASGREGGESDMELDLLAETESDSDDNEQDHEHDNDNQSTHTQVRIAVHETLVSSIHYVFESRTTILFSEAFKLGQLLGLTLQWLLWLYSLTTNPAILLAKKRTNQMAVRQTNKTPKSSPFLMSSSRDATTTLLAAPYPRRHRHRYADRPAWRRSR